MSWENVKLEDLCISITDGDHQSLPLAEEGIPFIVIADINSNNRIEFGNARYVPLDYYEKLDDKRKPRKGDVLLTVKGSFGIPVYVAEDNPFVFQRDIAILKCNQKINPRFLYYYMKNREFYLYTDSIAIGAAQRAITLKALRNTVIKLPPLDTQQGVVNLLSAYDDLIENNQKQIKLLEEAAQRLYKEWFVDLRFPGHETTHITDGIPKGWKRDTVDSIITLLSGFAFKSADFSNAGTYKIVTIKNVQDGIFDGHNVSRIAEIPANMPKHCYLSDGDILLSLTGNVGRVCVVNGNDFLLNQRVAKLKSDYPAFAYCLFRSNDMFVAMGNLANGAAQQNLSPIKTGQIKIIIPSVGLLAQFEKIVSVYMEQILNLNKQIELLQEARDRLLPKLMNGEIEV